MGILDAARAASNSPHAAVLWAEGRRGLKDVQDLVLNAFPDSKQSRDEAGTIANPTSQLVTEDLKGANVDLQTDMIDRGDFRRLMTRQPEMEQEGPEPVQELEPDK